MNVFVIGICIFALSYLYGNVLLSYAVTLVTELAVLILTPAKGVAVSLEYNSKTIACRNSHNVLQSSADTCALTLDNGLGRI